MHNQSCQEERQGRLDGVIDCEERILVVEGSELTTAELDQARGVLQQTVGARP